ncbi:MAG: hypothetical protein K2N36_09085, partial [Ruminiclostridium sp.]|nr:hypothetical protein [Ruminiclostridium sp.]
MEGFDIFFCIVSIILFSRSLTACKEFIQKKDPSLFPSVKSKGSVAKVFFVITCIRFGISFVGIIGFAEMISFGEDSFYNNLGSVLGVFIIGLIVNIVTLIMGIISIGKYNEAQKAYNAIAPKPNGAVGGFSAAVPFTNTANNNGTNYANPNNYNAGGTGYNSANTNNTGARGGYQVNVHTNDPTQLRSATGDQSPFEAPPPNFKNYNYGNGGNNSQQARPNVPYQNPPQRTSQPPANYNKPAANKTPNTNIYANVNNTPNANAEPKQYVSQMPEVVPFGGTQPTANAPANSVTQKPAIPAAAPVPPEIKRENTVR